LTRSDIVYILALGLFLVLALFSMGPRDDASLYDLTTDMDPAGYRFVLKGECICEAPLETAPSGNRVCPVAATVCEVDFADSRGRHRIDIGAQPELLNYIYQQPEATDFEMYDELGAIDGPDVPLHIERDPALNTRIPTGSTRG
jgi:hypothetical protein